MSAFVNAEAAAHAFAGGGAALTAGRMTATHRVTQDRFRFRFGPWNVAAGPAPIEASDTLEGTSGVRPIMLFSLLMRHLKISDSGIPAERAGGVVWERHRAPNRVPRAAQKSCFGRLSVFTNHPNNA
jgi:hypothetical protein